MARRRSSISPPSPRLRYDPMFCKLGCRKNEPDDQPQALHSSERPHRGGAVLADAPTAPPVRRCRILLISPTPIVATGTTQNCCVDRQRWANADQLYGFSAECGLKAVMTFLGMPVDATGTPTERDHKQHVQDIWPEFEDFVTGKGGARFLRWLPSGEPVRRLVTS